MKPAIKQTPLKRKAKSKMKSAKLTKALYERCQHRCEICGRYCQVLEKHRIVLGAEYVLENIKMLCFKCHRLVHELVIKIKESWLSLEQLSYVISKRSREYKYILWGK